MEVFTLAALSALIVQFTTWLKLLRHDTKGAVTQVLAWLAGIAVAFLAVNANAMETIKIGSAPLASLDNASTVLFGLALASAGSFAYQVKKALDSGDSAKDPPLIA